MLSAPNLFSEPSRLNKLSDADIVYYEVGGQTLRVIGRGLSACEKLVVFSLTSLLRARPIDSKTPDYRLAFGLPEGEDLEPKAVAIPDWHEAQDRRNLCSLPIISNVTRVDNSIPPDPTNLPPVYGAAPDENGQFSLFYASWSTDGFKEFRPRKDLIEE